MNLTYREYGGWTGANVEVRVQGDQVFIGDRLPMRLQPDEARGLLVLAQRVLDDEDKFTRHPSPVVDANIFELEIQFAGGGSRCFVVRPPLDTAPPAFEDLTRELGSLARAAWRAQRGSTRPF